ncbi:DUF4097 family beta strand repeat-containing protein [Effusibacillus dendaii]|uniref:DUF4097 domain-containing protein n=1 Tax=Effusibacillus dendaii TaxID=2743772 RepID=A0A7I8DA17_9BACL|nr:DUF4097 family beta strand repeat-containing protein [Effusibacillus dendaii]BCJ87018.1 hypothetical protein skT53_20030 [Effusibacillus dendaii]
MRKVGTLTSALTLLVLGGLLLFDQLSDKQIIFKVLSYWPVIVFALGAELLWSLYAVKKLKINEEIRVDARSIALLCLVGVFSLVVYSQQSIQGLVQSSIVNLRDALSEKRISLPDMKFDAKSVKRMEIFNRVGTIDLRPSDSQTIQLKTKVRVQNLQSDQANQEAQSLTPLISQGETLRVEIDPAWSASSKITGVDLELLVPDNIDVQLLTDTGNVTVLNHVGNVVVSSQSGKVDLQDIKGTATVDDGNGQIKAASILGDVEIKTKAGSLDVHDIKGNVQLDNAFGQIKAGKIDGDLNITSRNGIIDLDTVAGNVEAQIENGPIHAANLQKAVTLNSSSGGITLESIVGGTWVLNSQRGNVMVRIPKDSDVEFIGESSSGTIKGPMQSNKPNESKVSEKLGRGTYQLLIRTETGSITVNPNL